MRIKTRGHSCIELSTIDGSLLLDPGVFSDLTGAFEGKQAVLITHEHVDHADENAIVQALNANRVLEVYAPVALAQTLRDQLPSTAAAQVHTVCAGADFVVGGIKVRAVGGTHATIHQSIDLVANVGYVLGDHAVGQPVVYHPGDSYHVPVGVPVDVLLLPVMAPWAKMSEAADFAVAMKAATWAPIHDGLLNERGVALFDRQLGAIAQRGGSRFERLELGSEYKVEELLARQRG